MEFFRVPNPNYSGEAFEEGTNRTTTISKDLGISGVFSALKSSGVYKVSTFLFDQTRWMNQKDCEEWVADNREAFVSVGQPEQYLATLDVQFVDRKSKTTPTDEELAVINDRYALEPLDADQVYVREMLLTNDQWGKHHRRLSRGFQRSIIGSMPGKSLLLGHPQVRGVPAIPEGRFFAAEEWRDETGAAWNRCKFYIVKTSANEHARAQLDGGVWQHTSVGMETDWKQCSICGENIMDASKCRHIPGERYDRSAVLDASLSPLPTEDDPAKVYCGVIYRGKGTAVEGSIVYWPELNGTRVLSYQAATVLGDHGRAKRILLGGDDDAADTDMGLTTHEGQSGIAGQAVPDGKEDEPMTDAEREVFEAAASEASEKVAALEASLADLTAKVEAQSSALEAAQASEQALRAVRVAEVDRLAAVLERTAELDAFKAAFGDDLASMPTDKLLALEATWAKTVEDTLPGGRQSADTERDPATGAELEAEDKQPEPRKSVPVVRLSGL